MIRRAPLLRHRGRVVGWFLTGLPLATAIGGPLSTALLQLDGAWGLHGTKDIPMYTCCIPCAEPFSDLHMTLMWWTAVRAAWIRDRFWVAGLGLDLEKAPLAT